MSPDVSTKDLKARLTAWRGGGTLTDWMLLTQAYHTARLADATERLADATERLANYLENNQVSILEGADIANALALIAGRMH